MLDKYFSIIYDFVKNRRGFVSGIIVILTIVAIAGLGLLDFDSNIKLMLPDKDNIHRTINFLRESNLSDKVIISLALISDDKGKDDLFLAAEQLEGSLKPPLFTKTISGASSEIMEGILDSDYFPLIATENDFKLIEGMITEEYVAEKMKEIYMQLLRPQSIFTAPMFYSDPLGIKLIMLDRLKKHSESMGYDVTVENGRFISSDGRHTMIIAHTPVPITDSSGSKELIETLKEKIARLPSYVNVGIISGHLHAISNEKVIKRDIRLTIGIAATAFLLLFFVVFRDIRAVLVFLVPVVSVILSINFSSLIIGNLSYLVVGLGTVIAGIAVDYGIHIFVTVRNSGSTSGVIRQVARPILMGALTTVGIFAAFFFSDIQGYHQLALFSIISIVLSLFFALFILPHFLAKGEWISIRGSHPDRRGGKFKMPARTIVVSWVLLLIAAMTLSFKVAFESDVAKLDGTEKEVLQAEADFQKTWGGQDSRGIFVVKGNSQESALEKNDLIFKEVIQGQGGKDFLSLSEIWPSERIRSENSLRWNEFWKNGKEASLKNLIRKEAAKYQLRDSAFAPFFDNLYINVPLTDEHAGELISALKERFLLKASDGYRVLSFFPDREEYVRNMSDLSSRHPGTFIVSRKELSRSISGSLSAEVKLFMAVASVFIVSLTFLFFKDLTRSLLALVPVITNIFLLLGFMSLFGLSLNIANLISGIIAMGLCIDYGIFMAFGYENELKRSAVLAVTISAVTTIVGAGVLVFANHPALFSIGVTMVIGVTAGYLSSVLVIPSIEKLISTSPALE